MAHDADIRLAAVAGAQHGVFTIDDVRRAGASTALASRRVKTGRWVRLASGLYAMAGAPETWMRTVSAAVLRLGSTAAASHRTAAHLHGLYGRPQRIEVVTNATGVRSVPFIVHQCLDLVPEEILSIDGISTTDIERTITDIGVPAGVTVTQRVLDDAVRKELTTLQRVALRIHRYGRKGRRGIGPARRLVVERLEWDDVTDSVLEDAFLRLAKRAGLPRPTPQRRIVMRHGKRIARVDFDFGQSLVVELDSEKFHTDPHRFRDDRRRQNALTREGLTILRFTWWDVMANPEYVASMIAGVLTKSAAFFGR